MRGTCAVTKLDEGRDPGRPQDSLHQHGPSALAMRISVALEAKTISSFAFALSPMASNRRALCHGRPWLAPLPCAFPDSWSRRSFTTSSPKDLQGAPHEVEAVACSSYIPVSAQLDACALLSIRRLHCQSCALSCAFAGRGSCHRGGRSGGDEVVTRPNIPVRFLGSRETPGYHTS